MSVHGLLRLRRLAGLAALAGACPATAFAGEPVGARLQVVSKRPALDIAFDSAGRLWAAQVGGVRCVRVAGSRCPPGTLRTAGVDVTQLLPAPDGGIVAVGQLSSAASFQRAYAWVPAVGRPRAVHLSGATSVAGLTSGKAGQPLLAAGPGFGARNLLALGPREATTVVRRAKRHLGAVTLGSDGGLFTPGDEVFERLGPTLELRSGLLAPQLPGVGASYGAAAAEGGAWLPADGGRLARLVQDGVVETVQPETPVGNSAELVDVESIDQDCRFEDALSTSASSPAARVQAIAATADGAAWVVSECSPDGAELGVGSLTRIAPPGTPDRVTTYWLPASAAGWSGSRLIPGPDGRLYFAGGEGIQAFLVSSAAPVQAARLVSARRRGAAIVVVLSCVGPIGEVCSGTLRLRHGGESVRSGRYFLSAGTAAMKPTTQRPFSTAGLPGGKLRVELGDTSVAVG